MPENPHTDFSSRLLRWFKEHGRHDLPWQQEKTPYRVWISEIMLQQTQVSTVIPYYIKFMSRFPRVTDLAAADEDDVFAHWSGLGYYARARNLHRCAKIIVANHAGSFPESLEELVQLPGIGRSTAGAILAIAFQRHAVILDGNVKRVLCRHQNVEGWPGQKNVENELWNIATQFTPANDIEHYTQAIMDLGATVCSRSKPQCHLCPVNQDCQGLAKNKISSLPNSRPRKELPTRHCWLIHPKFNDMLYLEKRPPQGIWGSLWCFPLVEKEIPKKQLTDHLNNHYGISASPGDCGKIISHTFSHFKLTLTPIIMTVNKHEDQINENNTGAWRTVEQCMQLGLPAPVKSYLKSI